MMETVREVTPKKRWFKIEPPFLFPGMLFPSNRTLINFIEGVNHPGVYPRPIQDRYPI
jgi:hypothetical protein